MDLGIASVAGITALCYLAAMAVKATAVDNKWLPVICGVIGAILGVAGMYTMPDFPAADIINVIMDRCSQIAIIMRPGVGSCSGPFVEIISLMDYDVLWVILACIAIDLFDLFCNR